MYGNAAGSEGLRRVEDMLYCQIKLFSFVFNLRNNSNTVIRNIYYKYTINSKLQCNKVKLNYQKSITSNLYN